MKIQYQNCIKGTALLLAVLFVCMGVGCRKAEPSPHAGVYRAVSVERENTSPTQDLFPVDEPVIITLRSGGSGTIQSGNQVQTLKWALNGASFHADLPDRTLGGVLRSGVLTVFDYPKHDETTTLVCDEIGGEAVNEAREALRRAIEIANATPAPTPEPKPYDESWWNGKWYGWVDVSQGTGKYQSLIGERHDQIAEIQTENGSGKMTFYAFEDEKEEFGVGVALQPGKTATGSLASEDGSSILREAPFDAWLVEPADGVAGAFDHMIEISAVHTDEDGDSVTYHYFLRPWGMSWEDVKKAGTIEDAPFRSMMPLHYDEYTAAGTFGELGMHDAKLVGSWYHYSGDSYSFHENGTGVYRTYEGEEHFTYMTNDDQLIFHFDMDEGDIITTYRIEGRNLIITTAKGREVALYK